jgi:tetratricopeptide (TPR) repeat protein
VVWAWERPELQHQIFHLRRAIQQPGFARFNAVLRCQIFTNLANQLNSTGRFVEALEYWERALEINPHFGMALGNRGFGLEAYAQALYDRGHQGVFLCRAHETIDAALSSLAIYENDGYDDAKSAFRKARKRIEAIVDVKRMSPTIDLENIQMGSSKPERQYRRWCLDNCLF